MSERAQQLRLLEALLFAVAEPIGELLADKFTLVLAKSGELRLVVPAVLLIGVTLVAGTVKLKVLLMLSVPPPVLVMVRPLVGLLIGPLSVMVLESTWNVIFPSVIEVVTGTV